MFGIAKKIGMTRVIVDGKAVPVTALELGDNVILQKKTVAVDGYSAVQLAAFPKKKSTSKSTKGHTKKHAEGSENQRFAKVVEFKVDLPEGKTNITFEDILEGKFIDVVGTTKGRGFQGVVRRHGFAGLPASRGHDHQRHPGSIGSRWPQRTMPGKRMAGQMGYVRVTVKSLKVVGVDAENKLFFVAGSVPGANTGLVTFSLAKNKKQ